jgi:hypothetical protein
MKLKCISSFLAVVLCLSASTTCAQLSPNAGPSIARQLITTIIINFITSYGANYAYDQTLGKNLPTPSGTSILQATIEFKTHKELKTTTVRRLDGSLICKYEYDGRIDIISLHGKPTLTFYEMRKTTYHSENDKPTYSYSGFPFKPETVGKFKIACKEAGPIKPVRETEWEVNTTIQIFLLSKNNAALQNMFPGIRVGILEYHRTLTNQCDISSNSEIGAKHLVWVNYNKFKDLPYPKPGDMTTSDSVYGIYGSSYTEFTLQYFTM